MYATSLLSSIPERYWGPVPLTVWLIAGGLYVVLVAVVRAAAPASVSRTLGYPATRAATHSN